MRNCRRSLRGRTAPNTRTQLRSGRRLQRPPAEAVPSVGGRIDHRLRQCTLSAGAYSIARQAAGAVEGGAFVQSRLGRLLCGSTCARGHGNAEHSRREPRCSQFWGAGTRSSSAHRIPQVSPPAPAGQNRHRSPAGRSWLAYGFAPAAGRVNDALSTRNAGGSARAWARGRGHR